MMILHNIDLMWSVVPFQVWKSIKTGPTEMLPNYFTDERNQSNFPQKNLKETRPPVQRASITHQQSHTPIPNPKIDHTFFVYRVFRNRGYIGERGSATWKKFSLVPRFSYRTASLTPDRVAGTPLNAENQSIIIAASLKEEFLGGIYNRVHQSINISINQ